MFKLQPIRLSVCRYLARSYVGRYAFRW